MRHRSKKVTLDRKTGPRRALLKTLVEQVILFEKVTTTVAKAKAVRPLVERLVTHGKKTDIASFRYLLQRLPSPIAARKVRDVLGPRFKDRAGGYTRIVKVGSRRGDGADVARIEFVELSAHLVKPVSTGKEKK
ncbi:MAG: 50S ribosomal protein L17 [bacterium]|nr:50S ribosomal protein L17 [bacterium]